MTESYVLIHDSLILLFNILLQAICSQLIQRLFTNSTSRNHLLNTPN